MAESAVFNQLNAVDCPLASTEYTAYRLGTTTAGVTEVQFNSIRLVNHGTSTIFVTAWSVPSDNATGAPVSTSDQYLLVNNFAIPPDDWRELVDTKVLAHAAQDEADANTLGASIIVSCDTANSLNVLVNGAEFS